MGIHRIEEAVIILLVLHEVGTLPIVSEPRLLRSVLMRETTVIACLQLEVLRDLVLIVEFHLP